MQTVIALLGIGLFIMIACSDIRTRRIPNVFPGAVGALGLVRIMLAGDETAAFHTLTAAAAMFAIAFVLFARDVIGGGDAKLLPASVLLVGHHDLIGFLLVMSLFGALVAIAIIAVHKRGRGHRPDPPLVTPSRGGKPWGRSDQPSVPYGVAIAAAAMLNLVLQSTIPG